MCNRVYGIGTQREREREREREVWGVFPSDELIDGLSVCARKFI